MGRACTWHNYERNFPTCNSLALRYYRNRRMDASTCTVFLCVLCEVACCFVSTIKRLTFWHTALIQLVALGATVFYQNTENLHYDILVNHTVCVDTCLYLEYMCMQVCHGEEFVLHLAIVSLPACWRDDGVSPNPTKWKLLWMRFVSL